MFKPTFKLIIGNAQFNSTQNPSTQITSLEVQTGLAPFVDFVKIAVGTINNPDTGLAGQAVSAGTSGPGGNGTASAEIDGTTVKTGDTISIELGYDDNLSLVFTGTISSIEPDIHKLVLTGLNSSHSMTKTRINQTFLNQSAGQIVKDLAGQSGAATDVIENGIKLPYYAVDDNKHILQHAVELAERSGLDLWFSPENKLTMKKFAKTSPDHTLTYGENIIELQIQNGEPLAGQVLVSVESPASSQGNDAWHWFAKDTSTFQGSAGSGKGILIHEPGIRTKEGADTFAAGKLDRINRTATHGFVRIPGDPAIQSGDAVAIENVPTQSLNGLFQVLHVTHLLSAEKGFTTKLDIIAASGGSNLSAL